MNKFAVCTMLLVSLAIGFGCNNSAVDTKASDKPESLSTVATKPAKAMQCCFSNMDECKQFLPISGEHIKQVVATEAVTGELICSEDLDTPNSVTQLYTAGSGKLTLRISDYCVSPGRAGLDYDRKYKNTLAIYPKDKEIKELTDPNGLYKGFAVFSPSDKSSYLHAVVDGRFKVTIAGSGQDKFSDILSLWETVPVDKLAAFKKM